MPDITTEVESIEKRGGKTIVTVDVIAVFTGIVNINFAAQLRARARALIATGVINSTTDTIGDVAMGDINRLTKVRSRKEISYPGLGRRELRYVIEVNSE